MENYLIGFSTGILMGLAIALPGSNDVVTSLSKEELRELQRGYLTEEFRQSICKKYETQLESRIDHSSSIAICKSNPKQHGH